MGLFGEVLDKLGSDSSLGTRLQSSSGSSSGGKSPGVHSFPGCELFCFQGYSRPWRGSGMRAS